MADRKCSCCGDYYTDEGGHDLDKCIETCCFHAQKAEIAHHIAGEKLAAAYKRRTAQLLEAHKETLKS